MISEPLLIVRRNTLLNCPSTNFNSLTPVTLTISDVKLREGKHAIDSTDAYGFDRNINKGLQVELAMTHGKLFWFVTPDEDCQKALGKPVFDLQPPVPLVSIQIGFIHWFLWRHGQ